MEHPLENQFSEEAMFSKAANEESNSLPLMSLFRLDDFRNSRLVEVAAIFDAYQRITGGGFLLRDEAHEPLLTRAFPIAGGPFIFTEAVAVRQAIEEMVRLGEERLIICTSSMALLRCFHGTGALTGSSGVDGVVRECIKLFRQAPGFRLVCVHEEELVAARWLAQTGAQSQQHIQWDKPLMDELSGNREA